MTPFTKAITSLLLATLAAYESQVFIQNAISEHEERKRPDYSRTGRVRARKGGKSGLRHDGVLWDDDEDNWLVRTIEI